MKQFLAFLLVILIVGTTFAYVYPISSTKSDVIFTVTVTNNIFNQPRITSVEVETRPSTLLPSNFVLASFYQSGDLTLKTTTGSVTTSKNIGTLYIADSILTDNIRTVTFKNSRVNKRTDSYRILLLEDENIIDISKGTF